MPRPSHSAFIQNFRPHYGTEFRIELVDATSDKPVGSSLVTTQTLLQRQRDAVVKKYGIPFLSAFRDNRTNECTQHLELDLRTGMKSGYSSDFYAPPKIQSSGSDNKLQSGTS